MRKQAKLTLAQIALFGMLGALTFGMKVAMAMLPNIEPVSLMVILFAAVFGWKGLYPVYLYIMLELTVYPAGTWSLCYLYVWLVLFLGAMAIRRLKNPIWWALLSGLFGLSFGTLCSPMNAVLTGTKNLLPWIISGIPYDIIHAIGNFFIALFLFVPLRKLLSTLYSKMR